MSLFTISTGEDLSQNRLRRVLERVQTDRPAKREITAGMSPEEAADIASDAMVAALHEALKMDTWVDILKKYRDQALPPADLMNPAE